MKNELYSYNIYTSTKSFGNKPFFISKAEIADKTLTGFTSLYSVSEFDAKAIEQTGTAAGFKGVVWSERLWIDTDDEVTAKLVEKRLKEIGLTYDYYTTGNRGAHFGILRNTLPCHLLPTRDKKWV